MSVSLDRAPSLLGERALFGRAAELEAISRLIEPADPGGGALVLHGPPGIGKSALLEAAYRHAERQGIATLELLGVEAQADLPFAGLRRLMDPLLADAAELPVRQRAALLAALGSGEASTPDLFLVALAALNVITDAGARRRLLLIVDDAQWLDRGSAEVLAFVARRLQAEPVVMLVAILDGYESALLGPGLRDIAVGPLGQDEAGALLEAKSPDMNASERQDLLAQAEGNPLALVELAGASGASGSDWNGQPRLGLTERLKRAFSRRAAELPELTRSLLLVAAADDSEALSEVLAATASYTGASVGEDALTPALQARLVELVGIRVRFRHPLVRSAVYQGASDEQRRLAHSALAATIEDPDRVAWHRAAAASRPNEEVAGELEAAALRAERRGAIATAVGGLERAAALSVDPERRVGRLLRAAELAVELGRGRLVHSILDRVERDALTPSSSARMAWIRELFSEGSDRDPARVRALVADAERSREEGDLDLALNLLLGAAWRSWWATTEVAVRQEIVAAAERLKVGTDDPRLLAILAIAAPVERGLRVIEILSRAPAVVDHDLRVGYLRGLAGHTVGESEVAVRLLATSAEQLRAQGRVGLLAQALVERAWSTIQLGNWNHVDAMAQEANRLARETGQPLWAAAAQAAEAAAAGARGHSDLARNLAAQVEEAVAAPALSNILCVLQVARGVTALGSGADREAYDELARVFDPVDPAHHYAERHGALGYLAEAAARTGRLEPVRALLEELEGVAEQTPATLLQLGLLYARPLVSDDDQAEKLFVAALGSDAARWPFFRARVQLAYAEWLRRHRRGPESRAPLRAARRSFDALGAHGWSERARAQLRAAGERTANRATLPLESLSAQELQIAELAGTGLTNREIGERLFLSHRTVASHLYRVFPKLGITARAELAAALEASQSADGD